MQPLVSVITPVYNGENHIGDAIRSVLAQSYVNWELIVVDDASVDGTRKVIREFTQKDKRIRLIECAENFGGPARPRNIGIQNTKGEYIAFLDADDKWMPSKLERQLAYLQENNLDLVYTQRKYIGGNEGIAKPVKSLCSLLLKNPIATSSVLLKNARNIVFDGDKQLISVEDYYLWLNLFNEGCRIGLLPEPLVEYTIASRSISHENKYNHLLKRYYAVFKFLVATRSITPCVFIVLLQMFIKLIRIRVLELFK